VRFVVRDRETKFTASFDHVFASIGAEIILTPVRAPKANAFAERWVRTVREEWLDHLLVLSRGHLEAVLTEYVEHYNGPDLTAVSTSRHLVRLPWPPTAGRSAGATYLAGSSTSTTWPPDPSRPTRCRPDRMPATNPVRAHTISHRARRRG
jgi:hypothetical protein